MCWSGVARRNCWVMGGVRVPTSVLLAVLAAAGLLALAPALTRRYDATERVAAERATSTARVLSRRRRRRTVPGPRPINPPRFSGVLRGGLGVRGTRLPTVDELTGAGAGSIRAGSARSGVTRSAASGSAAGSYAARSDAPRLGASRLGVSRSGAGRARSMKKSATRPRRPASTALRRRRRVFLSLVLLNLVELAGVLLVGPGFWIGFSVSFVVLLADLVYLRRQAAIAVRRRRTRRRQMAWVAAEQAAVRREHDRRASERQSALRNAATERDGARRAASRQSTEHVERYSPRIAPGT